MKKNYKDYLGGARVDNQIYHLRKEAVEDMYIRFLDISTQDGYRIYTRTISAVFIMACREIFPEGTAKIEHFLGGEGLYAELEEDHSISFGGEIERLKSKMEEIIEKDLPIIREKLPYEEAMDVFEEFDHRDKLRLYNTLDREEVQTYNIGGYVDGFYGYLAPSTSYVEIFDLKYYYPGVIILFPNRYSDNKLPEFKEQKKLAKVFKQANDWADILDLGYVSSLNEKKSYQKILTMLLEFQRPFTRKKIAEIADMICKDDEINIILIAGPSSSGKTTFAERLSVHLKVNGKRPIAISVDDYFVDRDKTPLDEKGEPDFEALEAIDLKTFNEDLVKLLEGEEIELPKYNFITGKSERSGKRIKVDKDHPIIVEGIHGLNPKLASYIPEKKQI